MFSWRKKFTYVGHFLYAQVFDSQFQGRHEYLFRICSYELIILDSLGIRRETEYNTGVDLQRDQQPILYKHPLIGDTNLAEKICSMISPSILYWGQNRSVTVRRKMLRLKMSKTYSKQKSFHQIRKKENRDVLYQHKYVSKSYKINA